MLVRKLSLLDKNRIIDNLVTLQGEDRRLRFGSLCTDDYIKEYVTKSFEQESKWFGVDHINGHLVATCHVAYDKEQNVAELGLTVSADYRNQKLGQQLFDRGVTWARMNGAENIFMHCLTENKVIQHIARKGGMTVVTYDMGEKEGTIKVNKNQIVAGFQDAIMENMALYDQTIRTQQWFFNKFMKRILGR